MTNPENVSTVNTTRKWRNLSVKCGNGFETGGVQIFRAESVKNVMEA